DATLRGLGRDVRHLAVDEHGARTQALDPAVRTMFLTPDNQFPLGVTLSMGRRRAVLERAARCGGLIAEPDPASEPRPASSYLASLYAVARHQSVVHVGAFTHLRSAELPIGYAVLPPSHRAAAGELIAGTQQQPSAIAQRGAAALLSSTAMTRYIARLIRMLE